MSTTPMTRTDADEILYRALITTFAELDEAGLELTDHEMQIAKVAILHAAVAAVDVCQERGVIAGA